MSCFLGIDTSNYTTSLALCDEESVLMNEKIILDVKQGERGLRQSDALFHHINNLPKLAEKIGKNNITAIGCSVSPRDESGSYMPVFKAGECLAECLGKIMGVPVYKFSHQSGHIAAAAYSADCMNLLDDRFNVFHVSGGTTEILLCDKMNITKIGGTLDLNAGQAIDRTGVLLGMKFPCGPVLERQALQGKMPEKVKICVNGLDCNLSGLENKVLKLIQKNNCKEDISLYALTFIEQTLDRLSGNLREKFDLPILYAGGVMSNKMLRQTLSKRENTFFAEPIFSSDNASGVSLLARKAYNSETSHERKEDMT